MPFRSRPTVPHTGQTVSYKQARPTGACWHFLIHLQTFHAHSACSFKHAGILPFNATHATDAT